MVTKNRQEVIKEYWYLLHWIHHNEKIWLCQHSLRDRLYLIINKADRYIEESNGSNLLT